MLNEEDKTRINVHIFGNEYKLVSHSNQAYMEKIASFVNKQMEEMAVVYPRLDTQRLATLVSLNIADELFRAYESIAQADLQLHHEKTKRVEESHTHNLNHELVAVKAQYEHLKDEYKKLQTEYNEWTQLVVLQDTEKQ
jgi:cell division protein ZapA